jgi:hypothetical protein
MKPRTFQIWIWRADNKTAKLCWSMLGAVNKYCAHIHTKHLGLEYARITLIFCKEYARREDREEGQSTGVSTINCSFLPNIFSTMGPPANHSACAVVRHEFSSPARTLGSRFDSHSRHGCLSTFIVCLCCPVLVATMYLADPPSKESNRLSKINKLN